METILVRILPCFPPRRPPLGRTMTRRMPGVQARVAWWRCTPPAIFSPLLGLIGLGLAWRRAVEVYLLPEAIAEMILGAAMMLYGFCLLAYLAKVLRRPGVIGEEVAVLPGRAGLSALSICFMALAAVLEPYGRPPALGMLWAGMVLHLFLALVIVRYILRAPSEQRVVTPLWHLHFVGFIVAAIAAVQLRMDGMGLFLLVLTIPVALAIWIASAAQYLAAPPVAPLRPLLTIHLAPASLFALVSAQLGYHDMAFGFAVLAVVLFVILVSRCFWLAASGFSPLWGAFTFPVAAFAVAMTMQATPKILVDVMGFDPAAPFWRIFAAVALVLATVAVPYVTFRVLRDWARGTLAPATNAATA